MKKRVDTIDAAIERGITNDVVVRVDGHPITVITTQSPKVDHLLRHRHGLVNEGVGCSKSAVSNLSGACDKPGIIDRESLSGCSTQCPDVDHASRRVPDKSPARRAIIRFHAGETDHLSGGVN